MKKPEEEQSASALIDAKIASFKDWRGETLAKLRSMLHAADPKIVEEVKWMGTPVFSHAGIVTTLETYKSVVKLTFAKGAFLKDPKKIFNSSLEGNVRRAVDIREGEGIDEAALMVLIREAAALNVANTSKPKKAASKKTVAEKTAVKGAAKKGAAKNAATKRGR